MQLTTLLSPALLLLLTLAPSIHAIKLRSGSTTAVPDDAILLSKVKTLTLRANALTSHRRVPAVPQLVCTGPGCAHYKVDVMRCTNAGSGYGDEDIEWSCTANMPEEFKLGSTDVACEGYSSRDDPYVLKGSCGVEYRLLLTRRGEERYGKPGWHRGESGEWENDNEWTWGTVVFMLIFVGIFAWIVYSACVAPRPDAGPGPDPRRPGFFGGGWHPGAGGGGPPPGPGDPFDPPPPYPGKPYGSQPQQAWRPGFWSGAGVGAGLGYMAGNRGREREPLFGQPRRGNNNGGWFGGDNNNNHGHYQAPHRSDSNGSSSARHESTGFGSTSRR